MVRRLHYPVGFTPDSFLVGLSGRSRDIWKPIRHLLGYCNLLWYRLCTPCDCCSQHLVRTIDLISMLWSNQIRYSIICYTTVTQICSIIFILLYTYHNGRIRMFPINCWVAIVLVCFLQVELLAIWLNTAPYLLFDGHSFQIQKFYRSLGFAVSVSKYSMVLNIFIEFFTLKDKKPI